MELTRLIKNFFIMLNINVSRGLSHGVSLFGWQVKRGSTPIATSLMAYCYLKKLCSLTTKDNCRILDVGVGDGRVLDFIKTDNLDVNYEGLDLGKSNDFANFNAECIVHQTVFLSFKPGYKYDCLLNSHFIEHQNDLGMTLDKMFSLVKKGGYMIFEWPIPHRRLFGGHVNHQTPAQLAYNIAKIGYSVRKSTSVILGEYAVLVLQVESKKPVDSLVWDTGEIEQLAPLLPNEIYEDGDSYVTWDGMQLHAKLSKYIDEVKCLEDVYKNKHLA